MNLNLLISLFLLISRCFSIEISASDSLANQAKKNLILADQYWYTDSDKAREYYYKTIDLAAKANLPEVAEEAHEGLASIYFEKKEFVKAIAQYNAAIKMGKSYQSAKINIWQEYIAECLYARKKFSIALDTLTIAEKISAEKRDLKVLARIYDLRARIYYVLNLYSLSEIALKNAINYEKSSLSKKFIGRYYERLADLEMERGKYKEAIKYYNRSLDNIYSGYKISFKKELRSYINGRIADAYVLLKKYAIAEKYYLKSYRQAVIINNKRRLNTAINDLMELSYKQKKYLAFFNYYLQMEYFNFANDSKRESFLLKGNVFFDLNKIDSAEIYYKKALAIIERRQSTLKVSDLRISTLSTKREYFSRLARLYKTKAMDKNKDHSVNDSLFKYLNAGRSRTLYEKEAVSEDQPAKSYLESLERLQKYQRAIRYGDYNDKEEQSIKLNSLKYDVLASRIENLKEKIAGHDIISLQDFQAYLEKTNSAAVIYSLNSYEQYALIIAKNSFKIAELQIDMDRLKEKLELFIRKGFLSKDFKENVFSSKIAHELYQYLWQPLEDKGQLPANIIIIPDTPVLALPFDVLLTKEDALSEYSFYDEPRYVEHLLVNNYNVSILPSANVIKPFKPLTNEKTLILTNSIFSTHATNAQNTWSFAPLVFSKLEAAKIKSITDARVIEKNQATEREFRKHASENNIIHFATHAFVDTVFDLFSGLAFSTDDSTTDDGLLMGYEIEQLQLNCDLVTLSACESGKGRVLSGEGVLGLPRQFINAGARSALMSLWEIDDRLSSELMPLFYKNLLHKKQLKNEALGNAKRSIIKNHKTAVNGIYYANPFFWASFNLYGDVENNSVRENGQNTLVYVVLIIIFVYSAITFARKKYFF